LVTVLAIVSVASLELSINTRAGPSSTSGLTDTGGGHPVCTPLSAAMEASNELMLVQNASAPFYDEQLWLAFSQNFSSIEYNVTAIAQNDSLGYGPTYLVNGLSDKELWYQVGLSWRNDGSDPGGQVGFRIYFEVWNSTSGSSIFPASGQAGALSFDRAMPNDIVRLSLTFENGSVVMEAYDWNNKAIASVSYPSMGGSFFVGYSDKVPTYPTSLLTEWQHILPYFCSEKRVVYSNSEYLVGSAWLRIDEWNFTAFPSTSHFNIAENRVLFSTPYSHVYLNQGEFESMTSNGTEIYANPHQFITT
jgi:hypothetical protein